MTTMELEAGKLELIKEIININSGVALENIRRFIKEMLPMYEAADDTLLSKEEFFARVDLAKASIERGEGTKVCDRQQLQSFLNSL